MAAAWAPTRRSRFPPNLSLDAVAAVSPQVDISQPWDTRWAKEARRIGSMRALDASSWRQGCRYVVMFDPWNVDAKHYALLEAAFPPGCLLPVRARFAGHPAGFYLSETDCLKPIALAALTGGNLAEPCHDLHRRRAGSATYLFHLAGHCLAKRKPGWADQAITAALRIRAARRGTEHPGGPDPREEGLGQGDRRGGDGSGAQPAPPGHDLHAEPPVVPARPEQAGAASGRGGDQPRSRASLFREHRDAIDRTMGTRARPVSQQAPTSVSPGPTAVIRPDGLHATDPLRCRDTQASRSGMQLMDYLPALRDAVALRNAGQLDAAMDRFKMLAAEHPDRIEALLEAGKAGAKSRQLEGRPGLVPGRDGRVTAQFLAVLPERQAEAAAERSCGLPGRPGSGGPRMPRPGVGRGI